MTTENTDLGTANAESTAEAAPKTETTEAKPDSAPANQPDKVDEAKEAEAASEAARTLAQRKQSARDRVQQAVARQREAERQSAAKDKVIAELRSKLKEPDPAQYDDNAKYTADVLDYKMNQRDLQSIEREKQSAEEAALESFAEAWGTRVNEFKATAKDFEEIAYSAPISESTAMLIAEMEEGPEIAYELGKNHAEARRIDRMPERAKAIELGKIAARMSSPAPVRTTQAPTPIDPVRGKGAAGSKSIDDMSMSEYAALVAKETKR